MERYPREKITAKGYLTTLENPYRLVIEGLEGLELSDRALTGFVDSFRRADEFNLDFKIRSVSFSYD